MLLEDINHFRFTGFTLMMQLVYSLTIFAVFDRFSDISGYDTLMLYTWVIWPRDREKLNVLLKYLNRQSNLQLKSKTKINKLLSMSLSWKKKTEKTNFNSYWCTL